jgi:AbrB family looped-hinge helix DNA binding protein
VGADILEVEAIQMTVTVKGNAPLIVPPSVRRKVGLKSGDKVVFQTSGRVITILPKEESDVDDEYTPAQRKIVDAEIAEGLAEIKRGDYIEFKSAAELSAWIEAGIAKKRMRKKRK